MDGMEGKYGAAPAVIMKDFHPEWHEFMHYLYLPVRIPASDAYNQSRQFPSSKALWHIPPRLEFLGVVVSEVLDDVRSTYTHLDDPYVYVSARRGVASPDNPLNRPGWHTDDFGGTDINYIWSDRWPTRILTSDKALDISQDDAQSMRDMEQCAEDALLLDYPMVREYGVRIEPAPEHAVVRLDPYVIHNTPEVPPPGGMRSFFKISVSTHRYNLLGNSHNYGITYEWPMLSREEIRNHQGNKDYA